MRGDYVKIGKYSLVQNANSYELAISLFKETKKQLILKSVFVKCVQNVLLMTKISGKMGLFMREDYVL